MGEDHPRRWVTNEYFNGLQDEKEQFLQMQVNYFIVRINLFISLKTPISEKL